MMKNNDVVFDISYAILDDVLEQLSQTYDTDTINKAELQLCINNAIYDSMDLYRYVSKLLTDLGVTPDINGYLYMRYIILLLIKHQRPKMRLFDDLYQSCAEHYQVSAKSVERSIRYAVESGSAKKNEDVWNEVLAKCMCYPSYRPTNGEFIYSILDYVQYGYLRRDNNKEDN